MTESKLLNTLAFCGAIAIAGAACSKGSTPSGPVCALPQVACGQVCIDVTGDPDNCGGCGIPCTETQSCQGGVCVDQVGDGGGADGGGALDGGSADGAAILPTLVTSAPGAYWQTGGLTSVTSGKADVTVDDSAVAQVWEGFGGSFNEMGWSYLSLLKPADRDLALHLLYGDDGARFVFGRIPIGASDYAMERYTDDEVPSGSSDPDMASFSIARDELMLIPFVKAVQAIKADLRFWASPWTPPTWMKAAPFSAENPTSPFDGGSMKGDDATLTAYAQYLIKFVQAYAQQGIKIEAISAQNEPSYTGTYPTCAWTPAIYDKFIGQYLGPALSQAVAQSQLPATKIILGTFNGGSSDHPIVNSVMGDATARGFVDLFAFQWGMLDYVGNVKAYHLPIWQSEHQCGNDPWVTPFDATAAPNDQAYAVVSWGLIRDWIKAGVTAYSAWNMVLDTVGLSLDTTRPWPQNALLTVDTTTNTLSITPTYYVFRHLSQFVVTGAKVVGTSGGDAVAFKNPDGSIVLVLYNAGAAKTLTVAVAARKLQLAMPGNGWATVVAR
ncbi:MAG: glycoside hydrolase family 30 beta sandwich domain-containing protein [Polyangia bacterium]|jgi:glucosylceramidase